LHTALNVISTGTQTRALKDKDVQIKL